MGRGLWIMLCSVSRSGARPGAGWRAAVRWWRWRGLSFRVVLLVHACLFAECLALVEDPQGLFGQRLVIANAGTEPDVTLGQALEHPDAVDTGSGFQQPADQRGDGHIPG